MNLVLLLFALLLLGVAIDCLRLSRDELGIGRVGRGLAFVFGLLAAGALVASVLAPPSADRPTVHGLSLALALAFALRSLFEAARERRDTPRLAHARLAQGLALAALAVVFYLRLSP